MNNNKFHIISGNLAALTGRHIYIEKINDVSMLDEFIDSEQLKDAIELRCKFLSYLKTKVSCGRFTDYKCGLYWFREFLRSKNIKDLNRLTTTNLLQYQYYLYRVNNYKEVTVRLYTWAVRRYLMWLYHEGLIYVIPWKGLTYVKPLSDESIRQRRRYYNITELNTLWNNNIKRQNTLSCIKAKQRSLDMFFEYIKESGVNSVYKFKKEDVPGLQEYLKKIQYDSGKNYSPFMQNHILFNIKQFVHWLYLRRILLIDPFTGMDISSSTRGNWVKVGPALFKKKEEEPLPDPLLNKYKEYFIAKGYRPYMADAYIHNLKQLYQFIKERGITDIKKVTKQLLLDYHLYLTKSGKYATGTICNRLTQVRSYFKFLVKYDIINCDPSSCLDLPKNEDGLPRSCMTEREVNLLLSLPDTYESTGIKDKTIMEILYSTGVRSGELSQVKVQDIDFTQRLITIYYPKGGKGFQRVVPIGKIACYWAKRYITEVRPLFISNGNEWLFLTRNGNRMTKQDIASVVQKYVYKSGLRKPISPHSFRVTCATHMLHNDADIRYVQEQLGHRAIKTTQGYTRLVPKDLKRIHGLCHPREKGIDKTLRGKFIY